MPDVAQQARGNACRVCGRPLKNAASVEAGVGPTCRGKARAEPDAFDRAQPVDYSMGTLTGAGLIARRDGNRVVTNVPQFIAHHSPTGFEIGYGGSGPADLALNVLHIFAPVGCDGEEPVKTYSGAAVSATAWRLHQDFKRKFIAAMDRNGGTVPADTIRAWISECQERLRREGGGE